MHRKKADKWEAQPAAFTVEKLPVLGLACFQKMNNFRWWAEISPILDGATTPCAYSRGSSSLNRNTPQVHAARAFLAGTQPDPVATIRWVLFDSATWVIELMLTDAIFELSFSPSMLHIQQE